MNALWSNISKIKYYHLKNLQDFPGGAMVKNLPANVENGLEDTGRGRVSWDEVREWHGHIYTTKHKIDS